MFVLKSKHEASKREAERKYINLLFEKEAMNQERLTAQRLVSGYQIRLGAAEKAIADMKALIRSMPSPSQSPFTAEEVKRLLMLCHPDKHDGKQMATDMTAKLLALKAKIDKS